MSEFSQSGWLFAPGEIPAGSYPAVISPIPSSQASQAVSIASQIKAIFTGSAAGQTYPIQGSVPPGTVYTAGDNLLVFGLILVIALVAVKFLFPRG